MTLTIWAAWHNTITSKLYIHLDFFSVNLVNPDPVKTARMTAVRKIRFLLEESCLLWKHHHSKSLCRSHLLFHAANKYSSLALSRPLVYLRKWSGQVFEYWLLAGLNCLTMRSRRLNSFTSSTLNVVFLHGSRLHPHWLWSIGWEHSARVPGRHLCDQVTWPLSHRHKAR